MAVDSEPATLASCAGRSSGYESSEPMVNVPSGIHHAAIGWRAAHRARG
jgi:hypothetical protein